MKVRKSMKKGKTIISLLCALTLCFSSGCGASKPIDNTESKETSRPIKISDYLYEITCDNYESDINEANSQLIKQFHNKSSGGCSTVQNGMICGRNYDWYYDDSATFVIHVPAAKDRHASIGIASNTLITTQLLDSGAEIPNFKYLPYSTTDGINDAGLVISINIVNYGEKGEPVMKNHDSTDDIFPLTVCRRILDNAGTIEEALSMIESMDICPVNEFDEAHYLISGKVSATDPTYKTVVVELIPDENKMYKLSVIDKFVDDKPIMTNFHLTGFDGSMDSLTNHPMGYERYQILSQNFDSGNSVAGMIELMKKVYYTQCYDLYKNPFWYSERAKDANLTLKDIGKLNLEGKTSNAGAYEKIVTDERNDYLNRTRNSKTWQTVHTSIYDINNLELSVLSQEGSIVYKFNFEKRIE